MKTIWTKSLNILMTASLVVFNSSLTIAQDQPEDAPSDQQNMRPRDQADDGNEQEPGDEKAVSGVIDVVTGDIYIIDTKNLKRVSITNPDIADISDAKPEKVFIVGKKPGQTVISVWDDGGKRTYSVRVASENLDALKKQIEKTLEKSGIKGVSLDKNSYQGKLEVSGTLSKDDRDTFGKLMEPFSDKMINLVKEERDVSSKHYNKLSFCDHFSKQYCYKVLVPYHTVW